MRRTATIILTAIAVTLTPAVAHAATPTTTGDTAKHLVWQNLEQPPRSWTVFAVRCHYVRRSIYSCRYSASTLLGVRVKGHMLVRGQRIAGDEFLVVS